MNRYVTPMNMLSNKTISRVAQVGNFTILGLCIFALYGLLAI